MQRDDEDVRESTGSSHYFNKADHGKEEATESQLQNLGKDIAAHPLHQEKIKLQLSVLKQRTEDHADKAKKKDEKEEQRKAEGGVRTRTLKQEEEERKEGIDKDPNAERMMRQGQSAAAAKEEQQREGEIQQEPS